MLLFFFMLFAFFVFMTFLVGNDFLPHMPSLDIGDGAFDLLFNTYKEQRPTWGDGEYLTDAGNITDPARLEAFIAVIGAAENEIFEKREENEAVYLKKKRKWDKRDGKPEGPSDAQLAAAEAGKQADYISAVQDMVAKNPGGNFIKGWTPPTDTNAFFKNVSLRMECLMPSRHDSTKMDTSIADLYLIYL